jgi:hypothetical protein
MGLVPLGGTPDVYDERFHVTEVRRDGCLWVRRLMMDPFLKVPPQLLDLLT